MLFTTPSLKNLTWKRIALLPVGAAALVGLVVAFGAGAIVDAARDRLRHGFWG